VGAFLGSSGRDCEADHTLQPSAEAQNTSS